MKALNPSIFTPISHLSIKNSQPRQIQSLPTFSPIKLSIPTSFKTTPSIFFHARLGLISSVLSTELARALTYEEALNQSVSSSQFDTVSDFDFGFVNPAVVIGGAVVLAVPLVLSQIFKKPKKWGFEFAKIAYGKLGSEGNVELVDIRAPVEVRKVGSPDLRDLGKKPVAIVYDGEDKPSFLKKLGLKFKEPENTTLFILDKFDGNSELVAELVTSNGFKAAYAIKDGVEGPRGWKNSGLPWTAPIKTQTFDFTKLTDAISGAIGDGYEGLSVTLGIVAVAGLGFLAYTEIETILQVLGSAGLVQFVSTKFLFSKARMETLKEFDEILTTTVAPNELFDDIKQIGKAFLPTLVIKALPSPAESSPSPASIDNTIQKIEAALEPAPQVNSVPKTEEVKAESLPGYSRSLSPYPSYPDFRPPTSPMPSQPVF